MINGDGVHLLAESFGDDPNDQITELNIPTATPLVYEFDDAQEPIPQKDAIAPLQGRYLGDQEAIRARIEGVKAQTK